MVFRITDKCKYFLRKYNNERIEFVCVVDGFESEVVKHNCRGDKHIDEYVNLSNVRVNSQNKLIPVKNKIFLKIGDSSKFNECEIGDTVSFDARIQVLDNKVDILYPSRIKIK